jgi:hypothetical protein
MLATKCLYLCAFIFAVNQLVLAVQLGVSWSVGPMGTVAQVWSMIGGLKGCKLD